MDPLHDYPEVLESIEAAVLEIWRQQPAMTNYAVMRAYDATLAHYLALARHQTPKTPSLTGLDAMLFEVVREVCDWRLGLVQYADRPLKAPIPADDLVACLRKLRKSVDFWTQHGGRQGYMEHIEKFIP